MDLNANETDAHAWNPGLSSEIPARLLPLVTLFRSEIAIVEYDEAKELSDFTGLSTLELATLRPERLVLHELLVRVTSDLSVQDGPAYEELGINLRAMVAKIFDAHVKPQLPLIIKGFDSAKAEAAAYISDQLDAFIYQPAVPKEIEKPASLLRRLFGSVVQEAPEPELESTEVSAIAAWKTMLSKTENAMESACLTCLIKIVGSMVGRRGHLVADKDLVVRLVTNRVSNSFGCQVIADLVDPIFEAAIAEENFRLLPLQEKPVIMNVKGASASGKSTIRPQQRQLAEKLGIPWEDFAVVSPDYWRKYLLEYESLGQDFKYGAMLTGQELEIIDQKLDQYMAFKARNGYISHLLIDRFRFDSFSLVDGKTSVSKLLSRFGDRVFMFFMITPPQETVVRAWSRGLTTGRYKAVDDLLYHNVEAFKGMPALFLSWINLKDKNVHFEFLDNSVKKGRKPKTAAFGWNNTMTILDVGLMLDIDRFKKVNIEAQSAGDVLDSVETPGASNTDFIKKCAQKIREVKFADAETANIYAKVLNGRLVWWDYDYIESRVDGQSIHAALEALGYEHKKFAGHLEKSITPIDVNREKPYTLGSWLEESREVA